ncbi:thrombospondin, partial [Actinoplanes sp. NPDC051633]|uniref:thrombospondin n=1 Tax=Actinoplanes sp. NPDC051633 TaxID=3155670 RepID=UPI003428FC93
TFRRSATDTAEDDRPTVAGNSTVAKPDDKTTTRFVTAGGAATDRQPRSSAETGRATVAPRNTTSATDTTLEQRKVEDRPREVAGPRPRASLLATLGLILSVVAALLVLSGPLLGYGIGVAVLALVLSLSGIHATGRRHVAGKSDALIGMVLSLAAIVVGVLALTGSLSWLGTDMQPVNSAREWLDAQFVDRF